MRVRIVTIAVCTLLLAACRPDEPLTHAQLVERADAICADALGRVRGLGAELPEPTDVSAAAWADVLGQTIPILEGMVDDLGALEPPPADAEGFTALLAAYEEATTHLEDVRAAAARGDSDAMSGPSEEATFAWVDADHVADRLGLGGCKLLGEG
jgi:hypothetical protein